MRKAHPTVRFRHHKQHRDSLEEFIAKLPRDVNFDLHDWLKTLKQRQLRMLEEDALNCYDRVEPVTLAENAGVDLVDIALMSYCAETCLELDKDVAADRLDNLLIGLAVAACIERLKRAGWVTITGSLGVILQDPRPYRVTKKGLDEGVWSHEPMTLWVLGNCIEVH